MCVYMNISSSMLKYTQTHTYTHLQTHIYNVYFYIYIRINIFSYIRDLHEPLILQRAHIFMYICFCELIVYFFLHFRNSFVIN